MRKQVDIGSALVVATSAMRIPLRPREATTRNIPTTRSMLCVPVREDEAPFKDGRSIPFEAGLSLVSTMWHFLGF
jgi:hypothetical protein